MTHRLVSIFARWYRLACLVVAIPAMFTIFFMMTSTAADVTGRYFFRSPIQGVFEINEVLLVACVFLGMGLTQIKRGHIRVTLVLERVPLRVLLILDMIGWVICFVFLSILGWETWKQAVLAYKLKEFRWGAIVFPIWWAKFTIPIGCWMTCIQLLFDIWTDIARLLRKLPLEAPEFGRRSEL